MWLMCSSDIYIEFLTDWSLYVLTGNLRHGVNAFKKKEIFKFRDNWQFACKYAAIFIQTQLAIVSPSLETSFSILQLFVRWMTVLGLFSCCPHWQMPLLYKQLSQSFSISYLMFEPLYKHWYGMNKFQQLYNWFLLCLCVYQENGRMPSHSATNCHF